jgi:hypothetical protein
MLTAEVLNICQANFFIRSDTELVLKYETLEFSAVTSKDS